MVQQQVKTGRMSESSPARWLSAGTPRLPDYGRRLSTFEAVFGAEHVEVHAFRREALAAGCVVTDFSRKLGIAVDPSAIRRMNDGLSVDATRIILAYNRFDRRQDGQSWQAELLLRARLREIPGAPFRVHPAVLDPVLPELQAELRTVEERYGIDLREDWTIADPEAVRTEADLLRFSRASLDWLAAAADAPPIRQCEGPEVARLVSAQVARLRRRPTLRHVPERVRMVSQRELRRLIVQN